MEGTGKEGAGGTKRLTTCQISGPTFVDTKDGKIVRVMPMQFDESEVDSWRIDVNGHTFKPPLTHPMLPWGLAAKNWEYSENRVGYPMKRVDWDPQGERNPHNRGISGYERISWDEMYEILASEIRRVYETYGPSALCWGHVAHPQWGSLHYFFSDGYRFWHQVGSTYHVFTPNSWEGWACGTTLMWGNWPGHGIPAAPDSLQDISENTETIIIWGVDPMFRNIYNGIDHARILQYWKNLGKRAIIIEPRLNDTGLAADAKWLPIYPGTDGALACAIAYVWITEGTYLQDYLDTHTLGFDEDHMPEGAPAGMSYKTYILGEGDDATPKTPEWAAAKCGIPARTIRDLAHVWAATPTSLWVMYGGACRRQFAHEFTRLVSILQVMQGIGRPGVNQLSGLVSLSGPYDAVNQKGPGGYADGGMNGVLENYKPNCVDQELTFQRFLECMENPPQTWHGGMLDVHDADMFFQEKTYPAPGCSEIHFLWHRGSTLTNPPDHKKDTLAMRNEKIETYVVAAPWFDRNCRYADLVLPITTNFEHQDMTEPASIGVYVPPSYTSLRSAIYHQQIVEPYGESKTDMAVFDELSHRLGYGDIYMEGNTEEDLVEKIFNKTNIPIEFDEFKEKGYYVWPAPKDYKPNPQFRDFYLDPENHPMDTPTGKIEIFSTLIYEKYGYNEEIPAVPHYIPEIEGREGDEELRAKYPLQMLMAHPKWRMHGKYNDCEWLAENYKVKGPDGYLYEPVYLHPEDAAARGLEHGDIVRCFNDRGQVLAGVQITRTLAPGVGWLSYGAWNDPISEEADAIDRGGDGNVLSNPCRMSEHHIGGAYNSTLFDVEKADLEALARDYPEGWAGTYSTWNKGR